MFALCQCPFRASTALKVTFDVCPEMRKHMKLLPKTGFIQAQSSFNAQLKFLPRWGRTHRGFNDNGITGALIILFWTVSLLRFYPPSLKVKTVSLQRRIICIDCLRYVFHIQTARQRFLELLDIENIIIINTVDEICMHQLKAEWYAQKLYHDKIKYKKSVDFDNHQDKCQIIILDFCSCVKVLVINDVF